MVWKKAALVGGKVLSKWFFWRIFFAFLIILVISIITMAIQEQSLVPIVEEIGGRLVIPTVKIQEYSAIAIEQGGLYTPSENFFSGVFEWFLICGAFLASFYMIFLWIKLFTMLFNTLNNTQKLINICLAITLFFIFQILYLLIFTPNTMLELTKSELLMTPFTAFGTFFEAIPYLFSSVFDTAERVVGSIQTEFNESINIINNSNITN